MKNLNNESLARYLATILFSHKIVVIFVFCFVFISFLAYAILAPEMYRAEGVFLVKAKAVDPAFSQMKEKTDKSASISKAELYSESQLLNSGQVISSTVEKLIEGKLLATDEFNTIERLENKISESYTVDVDNYSKLLKPSINWANQQQAKVILNSLMDTYLTYRSAMLKTEASKDITKPEVSGYLDDWKKKKEQTLELIKKHNVPDVDLELANNLELKKEYQIQLAMIEKDKVSLKEDIKILTSMLNDKEMHLYSFLSSGVLSSLVDSLQAIQKEKIEADKLFLPNRIEVKELDQQFQQNYGKIKAEVASHLRKQKSVLKAKEQSFSDLKNRLKKLERRNIKLKEIAIKMDQLNMESSFLASSFETFYKQHNVSQGGGALDANIILLSQANVQLNLNKLSRFIIVIFGLVLAIALSFVVALILNAMEKRIKTPGDFQRQLKLPVLFSIEEV